MILLLFEFLPDLAYLPSFVGLGKDGSMRPPFDDVEIPLQPSVSKPVREKKRKRVLDSTNSEGKKPKKKATHKAKGNIIPLPLESVQRLRDEPEEEEEEEDSELVARVRADTEI